MYITHIEVISVRIQLSDDDAKLLKQIGKHYPQLEDLLARIRAAELESMSAGTQEHFSTYKGRVQCLTELRQLIRS
jgi:flagellar basal body-associated protein FliL